LSASNNTKLMSVSITALAVSLMAIIVTSYSLTNITVSNESYEDGKSIPQTREIWLFSQVDEHIDEDEFGIPPDQFSHDSIVVKKGDNVKIHFYNLEPVESQEHHTFTIANPYDINHDINAGEETSIEFSATESGIFDYFCKYHLPTMRGQLIVLDD
jgi:plastocyanin